MNSTTSIMTMSDAMASPATLALQQLITRKESYLSNAMSTKQRIRHQPMISSKSLKRSRPFQLESPSNEDASTATSTCFDMNSFFQASQDLEEAMMFPPISWPSPIDSSDEDDHDEDEVAEPSPKRRCGGLVRSRNSSDLSSLCRVARTTGRSGSNGSIC
ncbi:hypothetical protein IV203_008958 [Nitzschia inconspicua]|uniref:Uncharacterized protein n=1 Tax=Nitzschia inconspicua TaxID=303405 RepID=A0A9K3KZU0_9STRA|nr:hypothetical protein IV203_008958 [Nitzschia inconspicua]